MDWVVQFDCPESYEQYIHRVGRTARFLNKGRALLFLTPNEKDGMFELLSARNKVPIAKTEINPSKIVHINNTVRALVSQEQKLKYLAQVAIISYVKSVFYNNNKEVFNVEKMEDVAAIGLSWGLPTPPKIRFLKKKMNMSVNDTVKDQSQSLRQEDKEEEDQEKEEEEKA